MAAENSEENIMQIHEPPAINTATTTPKKRGPKPKKRPLNNQNKNANVAQKRGRPANVLLENETLIDEVKARRALWVRSHNDYHQYHLTAPLWQEVADNLQISLEQLRRRWKSLKDHYRRELKKTMSSESAPPSKWPYFKKMTFMKSQMFLQLHRGEQHLEILSDDEEASETNNELNWNGNPRKQEGAESPDYDMNVTYDPLVKMEMHMAAHPDDPEIQLPDDVEQQNGEQNPEQEIEENQEEQIEEGQDMSNITTAHDEIEQHNTTIQHMSRMQRDNDIEEVAIEQRPDISDMPRLQQHGSNLHSTLQSMPRLQETRINNQIQGIQQVEMNGEIPMQQHSNFNGRITHHPVTMNGHLVTVIRQRGNVANRMSSQQAQDLSGRMSVGQQQSNDISGRLSTISGRLSSIQQRQDVSGRISTVQRASDLMHERNDLSGMHNNDISRSDLRSEIDNETASVSPNISAEDRMNMASDDFHFFMSLLPHIRGFSSLQKLKFRSKVQQLIIEEANNSQQFDPLG